MYIIKEQKSINLVLLKLRMSVRRSTESEKAGQKVGKHICNTTGKDYNNN